MSSIHLSITYQHDFLFMPSSCETSFSLSATCWNDQQTVINMTNTLISCFICWFSIRCTFLLKKSSLSKLIALDLMCDTNTGSHTCVDKLHFHPTCEQCSSSEAVIEGKTHFLNSARSHLIYSACEQWKLRDGASVSQSQQHYLQSIILLRVRATVFYHLGWMCRSCPRNSCNSF